MTTYTYSIANDFPNGKVNTTKLHEEIAVSPIITSLSGINTTEDVLTIVFKADLSSEDKTILDGDTSGPAGGLIAAHDNEPSINPVQPINFADTNGNIIPIQVDSDGKTPIFIASKTSAEKFNAVTHNWCDKTTWYEASVKVQDETLSDSGDHTTFNSANQYWIDTKHGKIFNEDILVKNASNKWICSVSVDGTPKTENSPGDTDHDFTVNYAAGTLIFNAPIGNGHAVVATYWYSPATPGASAWTLQPPAGKKISLLRVELQFSTDIILKDTAIFQALGYVQIFAPQYCPVPYPENTLIPLGDPIKYKTMVDFLGESNGSYPLYPMIGGDDKGGWRSMPQPTMTMVWDYVSKTDIHSAYGMRIHTSLANNVPHGGTFATATFYCLQSTE